MGIALQMTTAARAIVIGIISCCGLTTAANSLLYNKTKTHALCTRSSPTLHSHPMISLRHSFSNSSTSSSAVAAAHAAATLRAAAIDMRERAVAAREEAGT